MQTSGIIFGVQHFSIHDGPGIRTCVFFKGCPLNCAWCHNPEGIGGQPALSFSPAKCVTCGACYRVCPSVHRLAGGEHALNREACKACGECAAACPSGALEVVGRHAAVDELMHEVAKDRRYYQSSGGGLTLTGGEPMAQTEFTLALAKQAKAQEIHTTMETSGVAEAADFCRIAPYIDLFLWDIKHTEPALHKLYTGAELDVVLENLRLIDGLGAKIVLRCPIIPGINDTQQHLMELARLSQSLANVQKLALMPYHRLGTGKTGRFGLPTQTEYPEPTPSDVEGWYTSITGYEGNFNS